MNENPQAFPLASIQNQVGMTLRDYFAGQVLIAIISKIPFQEFPEDWSPYEKTAIGAYDYADAMLKERSK